MSSTVPMIKFEGSTADKASMQSQQAGQVSRADSEHLPRTLTDDIHATPFSMPAMLPNLYDGGQCSNYTSRQKSHDEMIGPSLLDKKVDRIKRILQVRSEYRRKYLPLLDSGGLHVQVRNLPDHKYSKDGHLISPYPLAAFLPQAPTSVSDEVEDESNRTNKTAAEIGEEDVAICADSVAEDKH